MDTTPSEGKILHPTEAQALVALFRTSAISGAEAMEMTLTHGAGVERYRIEVALAPGKITVEETEPVDPANEYSQYVMKHREVFGSVPEFQDAYCVPSEVAHVQ